MPDEKTFMIEDAQIIFRNFSGEPNQYNRAGDRNFCVVLTPEAASDMAKDGWNIKHLKARDEGDEDTPYIQVAVKYSAYPPKIYLLTSNNRTLIDEGLVGTLDWTNAKTIDLIARGYEWTREDKSGVKAYLQTMFVTVDEDPLELKYAGVGE